MYQDMGYILGAGIQAIQEVSMPWQESTPMSQRCEFVGLAQTQTIALAELCRRFGISRKTGYKWLGRAQDLRERSRRPRHSPTRTTADMEDRVVALRLKHAAWGGRKIARRLRDLGVLDVPHPSTVTHILRRNGLVHSPTAGEGGRYQRFEHATPNALWQMDFKGDFALDQGRCYPLTVIDDHARFNLVLHACSGQSRAQVQPILIDTFRRYGLPERINTDNGQPWGSPNAEHGLSQLSVWSIRLGIRVSFSAPAHPQTNGKDERFHRTLKAEVLAGRSFHTMAQVQQAFDVWRPIYNHERPHDALSLAVPATRYQPSLRAYPETLAPIQYTAIDTVATVGWNGQVKFHGRWWKVSNALKDQPIAFRPTCEDGRYEVYFCHQRILIIDLRDATERA
jgi:transposase InsO family protein